MTMIVPEVDSDLANMVDDIFDGDWDVIVLDDNRTTFDEVINACMGLLGFTRADAEALAWTVHTTGKALAATLARDRAEKVVEGFRAGNVRATMHRS